VIDGRAGAKHSKLGLIPGMDVGELPRFHHPLSHSALIRPSSESYHGLLHIDSGRLSLMYHSPILGSPPKHLMSTSAIMSHGAFNDNVR